MTPRERWEAIKARGDYTVDEIDSIDRDTPWSDLGEPAWWLEMMEARNALWMSGLDSRDLDSLRPTDPLVD